VEGRISGFFANSGKRGHASAVEGMVRRTPIFSDRCGEEIAGTSI